MRVTFGRAHVPNSILLHTVATGHIPICHRTKSNAHLGKTALGRKIRLAGATMRTRFHVLMAEGNVDRSEASSRPVLRAGPHGRQKCAQQLARVGICKESDASIDLRTHELPCTPHYEQRFGRYTDKPLRIDLGGQIAADDTLAISH